MSEVKRKNKIDKQRKHRLRFKSRKHPKQSCYIPKSAVKPKGLYHTKLGKIHYSESLPDNIRDSRLVVHQGRYYVTIPTQVQRRVGENQARVVALDPGVRCFQAFFSENSCGFLGRFAIGKIQRLCQHLDDLISRATKVLAKRRGQVLFLVEIIRGSYFQSAASASWLSLSSFKSFSSARLSLGKLRKPLTLRRRGSMSKSAVANHRER